MQFQIIDKEGKVIAWLDSDNDEQLVHEDYILRQAPSQEKLPTIIEDGKLIPVFSNTL